MEDQEVEVRTFFRQANSEAASIFQRIDRRFEPEIFFILFPIDELNTFSVTILPDDSVFTAADFQSVETRTLELIEADPESKIVRGPDPHHGWTEAHETHDRISKRMIRYKALRCATEEAVNNARGNEGYVAYCGSPNLLENCEVVPILRLQKSVHADHYHLTKRARRPRYSFEPVSTMRSLIESVAFQFLRETLAACLEPNPPLSGIIKEPNRLLSSAGKSLVWIASLVGRSLAIPPLYDLIVNLSTLKYEGADNLGEIIIARQDHPAVSRIVQLSEPIPLQSIHAVRKLLQMASEGFGLLCDANEVYGLGNILPTYNPIDEDVFKIRFTKQFSWELLHTNHILMRVTFGIPEGAILEFSTDKFLLDLRRIFPQISEAESQQLCELASAISQQKHGCMLVISEQAESEAARLKTQALKVTPFRLTKEIIPQVTSIDGAVLIDPQGCCHALGVILDGLASPKCSPDRGSRYNSAIRYVFGRKESLGRFEAIAIVKSEDGKVNIFPDLMPQIEHRKIQEKIDRLRGISNQEETDMDALRMVMDELQAYQFYLTANECQEITALEAQATRKKPPSRLFFHSDTLLSPHPDMDDSYYLADED